MDLPLGIIEVDYATEGTLLVNFNDGTHASFSVEQLAGLQPHRTRSAGEDAEIGQEAS